MFFSLLKSFSFLTQRALSTSKQALQWGVLALACFFFCQCSALLSSKPSQIRFVDEFNVLNPDFEGLPPGLRRSQAAYILRDAATKKEKQRRLGQYYTIEWLDNTPKKPSRFIFEYQQASTGSKILKKVIDLPAPRSWGNKTEQFSIIGEEFLKQGRVMTWKLTLEVEGMPVAIRKSYLWEDMP